MLLFKREGITHMYDFPEVYFWSTHTHTWLINICIYAHLSYKYAQKTPLVNFRNILFIHLFIFFLEFEIIVILLVVVLKEEKCIWTDNLILLEKGYIYHIHNMKSVWSLALISNNWYVKRYVFECCIVTTLVRETLKWNKCFKISIM